MNVRPSRWSFQRSAPIPPESPAGRRRGRMSAAPGMTLLELMTVLAIVGLASSIAIPSFSDMVRRSRTRAEVRELRAFLSSAAGYARVRRECALIEVKASEVAVTFHPRSGIPTAPCDFASASPLSGASRKRLLSLLQAEPALPLRLDDHGGVIEPLDYGVQLRVKGSAEVHRFRVVPGTGVFRRATP